MSKKMTFFCIITNSDKKDNYEKASEIKKYLENKLKCFDIYKADSACFADYLKKISVQGGKNED